MRITLRLILSLVVATSAVVLVSASYQARNEKVRLRQELDTRATVLADSLRELAEPAMREEDRTGLQQLVEQLGNRQRLAGVAVYTLDGGPPAMTAGLPSEFHTLPALGNDAIRSGAGRSLIVQRGPRSWHLYALPIRREGAVTGALLLVHDAGYIRAQATDVWRENFARFFLHVLVIALIDRKSVV